jgi:hypothetical protein
MRQFYVLAISVLFIACNGGKDKPDVSGIDVKLEVERFEKSFFKTDTNDLSAGLNNLQKEYPQFYPMFMQNIIGIDPAGPEGTYVLKNIISSYHPINDSLQAKYKNLDWLKSDLTQSFKYVKHYFPSYKVPRVVTYVGTFDAPGVVLTPTYLGIGLHQFAGKEFSVYRTNEIQQMYPSYISRRFDKEYMVAGAMKAVADDIYPDKSTSRPLIEQMIEKGKHWFLLDHFLPDEPDSIKTGYSARQVAWLDDNEGHVWGYIIKNENLYSVEPPTIQTYIGEAPFTQGMPESSPGNLGQWVGWRIVQQYAQKHKEMNMQQILQIAARTIFEEAKYKPK